MKRSLIFAALVGLAATASVNAQSWTVGSGLLYANPTTTKVGIGTSTPSYGLHLNGTTFGVIKSSNGVVSDGSYFNVYQSQGNGYGTIRTYIAPDKIVQAAAGYYQANSEYSPTLWRMTSSAPVPVYSETYVQQGSIKLTSSAAKLTLRAVDWPNQASVVNHGFSFALTNYTKLQLTNSENTSQVYMNIEESNGYVGIGTVNPTSLLTVNGKIEAEEIEVKNVGADFVFNNEYKLRSLNEVENYIKEHKHLPEIAPAEETEKGIKVGEFSEKLLQKVEELTLYVIEQQKQIESLKSQLNK